MKKLIKRLLALVLGLCLMLACPIGASAEEGVEEGPYVVDAAALDALIADYIEAHNLKPENISVGYCYPATGETWYYNGDAWYYSASMYKVPLMMIYAEREHNGELTQDTKLAGNLTLNGAEELILVNSHNDYAHLLMNLIGTDPECRALYRNYATLPEDYYEQDFYDWSYFTARFMTEVMTTLYSDPERFPNVIDCLKRAQPEHYFHIHLGEYEIAQKYGSLMSDYEYVNHTTGIIYTSNPFILTVMTARTGGYEAIIADIAKLMADYTLTLDEKLAQYEAERAEQERLAAEEAEREAEQPEPEAEAEPEPTAAPVPSPTPAPTAPVQQTGETNRGPRLALLIGATLLLAAAVALALVMRKRKRSRVAAAGHYRPRH